MKDSFNREIDYLRLSVTDRCDLRCTYCMPTTGMCFLTKEELLSFDDVIYLVEMLAQEGIKKVKITGGEPLTRRDIISLIRDIKAIEGIEKVTLTTNGMLLERYAESLKRAKLDGLNVSLDTLDSEEFRQITRVGDLERVLAGLEKAIDVGLPNIKVNTVARGELEADDIKAIAALAKVAPIHVRFIELMPIGMGVGCEGKSQEEVMAVLEEAYGQLATFEQPLGNGPAHYFSLPDFQGKIGFISAIGHCFCEECDRIRITADGCLKTCLHMDQGCQLREAIQVKDRRLLRIKISEAVKQKPEKHHFLEEQGEERYMSQIGG